MSRGNPFKSIDYYSCSSASGVSINGTGIINIINGTGHKLVLDGHEVISNIPNGLYLFSKSVKVYQWSSGYTAHFVVGLFND